MWSRPVPADTALEIKGSDKPAKATRLLRSCLINPCMNEWMILDTGNVGRMYSTHWAVEAGMTCEMLIIWRSWLEIKPKKKSVDSCVWFSQMYFRKESHRCVSDIWWFITWKKMGRLILCCPGVRIIRRYREADFSLRWKRTFLLSSLLKLLPCKEMNFWSLELF